MARIVLEGVDLEYPLLGMRASTPVSASGSEAGPGFERSAGALTRGSGLTTYVRALQGVQLSLASGARLGLIGRNGSGKSTLLRVLAGLYAPTRGKIEIEGRVSPLFAVGLGVRAEATGRRNIILRGILNGLTYKEAEAHVAEIIEFADIGRYIDLPMRIYSAGMSMRLSFAMATAFEPEILLLDEWLGAGDDQFQAKAAARMNALVANSGITVIATHSRRLLKSVCTHALWLDGGSQRMLGPVDDVLAAFDADLAALAKGIKLGVDESRKVTEPEAAKIIEGHAGDADAAPSDRRRADLFQKRLDDLRMIRIALETYRIDVGSYPTTGDAWASFGHRQTENWLPELAAGYMAGLPKDPEATWSPDSPQYLYKSDGIGFKLVAHKTGDADLVDDRGPVKRDPKRISGRSSWAYGYWTSDYSDK